MVTEQTSDASQPLGDPSAQAPSNFDKDAYLLAFPDVAQAISEGVCTSPLQHYMDHGRQENRLSHHRYLRILIGRQLEGQIDFYGHNSVAGGWVFCGWTSECWDETSAVAIVAQFQNGGVSGESISAFYQRSKPEERGTGFVLFVQGTNEPLGPLISIDVRLDGSILIISAMPGADKMGDQEILSATRSLLTEHSEMENSREILTLLSTSGYGRLRQPLNVLNGSVDSYGYHGTSGGWFFCGWTTRSWDEHAGPDELIAHFADGDVISSETVAGFYPRDDLEGRGIGFVMFVPGLERADGSLTSVELRAGGIASFIHAPSNSQRFSDVEIAARLRPIIGRVISAEANAALLSVLSHKPYAGVETLAQPSDPILLEFRSAFVDEDLFIEHLGGSKSDPEIVARYLSLPISARPDVSIFFDREYYWQRYPDVQAGDMDPMIHFMRWGVGEKRAPHPLVDIEHMLAIDPEVLPDPLTIDALNDVLCRDLVDPSQLFSLEYYRSQLDGSDEVKGGLLRHFLEKGMLRGLKPNPSFDPIEYYRWIEGRTFDIRSSLRHFALRGGTPQQETGAPPTERQAKALFRAKANALQLHYGRHPLHFDTSEPPDLSVIMVVHNNFALTLQALASLRANNPAAIQVVIIDSGSTDETRHLAQYVSGTHLLQLDINIGFVRGCNAALDLVTADTVLYLNNDVELAPGAVAAALQRLRSDIRIGAVGAKIVRTHGQLQEAGCIIWRDGWTSGYLRGQSALAPEANFVRDVDFCSAAFLLARTSVLRDLGGFDDAFAPAYFEDVDLCLRIREAGYRIVYDPAVVVHHLEYGSSARDQDAQARIQAAHQVFFRKHRYRLRLCYASDTRAQLFARAVNEVRGRILLIEDQLPLRRLGSGFVRSNDIVRTMAEIGYQVTVYPVQRRDFNLAGVYADFPDSVEVMHDRALSDLAQFLKVRRGYYNTIWIARTHNLDLVKPILEKGGVDVLGGVRLVLDTEAIAATREALRRDVLGSADPFDPAQAIQDELQHAYFCQSLVAVNRQDAERLQALGFQDVHVLGHLRALQLTPQNWQERAGMLLIGAFPAMDSPNYDSLCWFVDEVLPLIEQQLGYETRLTVAGFIGEGVDFDRFRNHPRITLRGAVADMAPLYDTHRVFVAPTRYAAGLPYKVHEAASYGLPVVATELLRRQLAWEDGQDLLAADAADPAAFARQVLALYQSEELWNRIRTGAAECIRTECGHERYAQVLAEILQ